MERKSTEKTQSKPAKPVAPFAEQEILFSNKGKSLIFNPRTINLTVKEQKPLVKWAKLWDSMMDENIKLTYPEGTSFHRKAESCMEMLYKTVMHADVAELKEVLEDHLC